MNAAETRRKFILLAEIRRQGFFRPSGEGITRSVDEQREVAKHPVVPDRNGAREIFYRKGEELFRREVLQLKILVGAMNR